MGATVWRVRDSTTFRDVRRQGVRGRAGPLTVTWAAGGDRPRVAYAIGRPVGNAVARNRLRRRLRALVDDAAAELRPGAYLIAATPAATTLDTGELRRTLQTALNRLPA